LQRQRFIIRKRLIDYDEAKAIYGEHTNFSYVSPGIKVLYNSSDGMFYEQFDENIPTLCEEATYFNRREDIQVVFINGIYMGDSNVNANPIKHRDNKNRPKYPYVKFGAEPIDEKSFYFYKSLVARLANSQEEFDHLHRRCEELQGELQAEIERTVRPSKTSLLGPNCMGVYCPAGGLTFDESFSRESGSIGFVSQTGVGARRLVRLALGRGLRFSKVVSYGNASDLSGTDFLEYVLSDPETKTILLYVEGLTDGHRFFELLRECTLKKPVVLLKAGLSESGAGAVASHTASLAGSRETWQALFKQTGAIPVESLEEAVEQLVAVVNIPHIKRRNVGLVGRGGGIGCVTTDMCEREGLKVPAFASETRSNLVEATSDYAGSSVRNPVETGIGRTGLSKRYSEAIQIVAADPQIDIVMTFLNPEAYFEYDIGDWVNEVSTQLIETAKILPKPLAMMLLPGQNVEVFEGNLEIQRRLQKAGVACFSSLDVGIRAVSKLIAYYEFKDKHKDK